MNKLFKNTLITVGVLIISCVLILAGCAAHVVYVGVMNGTLV